MKKIIMTLAFVSVFNVSNVLSGNTRSKYSKANPAAVSKVDSAIKSAEMVSQEMDDDKTAESWDTVGYSGYDGSDTDNSDGNVFKSAAMNFDKTNFSLFFLCALSIVLPFGVLILAVVMFYKNRKMRYAIMEKAIESGQPIPDFVKRTARQSDEYLLRKGIRNFFLGLGLFAFLKIMEADPLHGIGVLVLIYGAGQVALSFAISNDVLHKKKKDREEKEDSTVDE